MKKYITLLLTVLATVFTVNAFAFTPPDKPASGWYVVDQANKLTEEQKTNLNKKIDGINKNTKNEFGVLIIQSMDGGNIEDVAQSTFRAWGVGKAELNNGVLLVISVGDRKMRLQTGKGAEGDLPDLRAKDILDENLKPALKKGDFYGGIDSTISAASSFLESRANVATVPAPAPEVPSLPGTTSADSNTNGGLGILLILGLMVAGVIGIVWYINRKSRKEEEARTKRYEEQQSAYRQAERDRTARQARAQAETAARKVKVTLDPPYTFPSAPIRSNYSKSTAVEIPHNKPATEISATAIGLGAVAAAAGIGGTAVAISAATRAAEAKKRKDSEEREAEARKRSDEEAARRRAADDEAAAARRRSEESSYSSYSSSSSSSSYDSGSSSSYDSGGGFGGGDSGGSGSSSDF